MPRIGGVVGRKAVQPFVLEELLKHPGEVIYIDDLAKNLGLLTQSVQNVTSQILQKRDDIEIEIRGRAWRYNPNKKKEDETKKKETGKRLFEEIGLTKSGHIVIQDDHGAIYLANELQ